MNEKEGYNSQQLEAELRSKFVKVQPDESFIRNLSEKLISRGYITLEKSKMFFYYLALVLFALFGGLFLWWLIRLIFLPRKKSQ